MNTGTKWIIGIIVVIILIAIGVSLSDRTPAEAGPIKVGFIGPLTGDAASYGEEDRNSIVLAVDEINASGGVNGRPLEVIYEDGQCTGSDAINAANKLINVDGVKFILGGACSGETLAVAPLAEENEVLLFSSWSTSPDVTNAGDFVFRNAPSDLDSGSAAARLALRNDVNTVAVVAENTDFAIGFANVFSATIEAAGGSITSREEYSPGTTDFRSFITKALSSSPDAILISPQADSGGVFVKQLKEQGYTGPIYSNAVINGEGNFNSSEGTTPGIYYSDAAGLSEEEEAARVFFTAYEERFGKRPDFTYYAGAGYDAVYILTQAIREAGENPADVRDYLYSLDEFQGVLGTTSFDENGDIEGVQFADFQVGDDGLAVEI